MALISGRQAHLYSFLNKFVEVGEDKKDILMKAEENNKKRQLIFSRWVFVMTYFEQELYSNPDQDLNKLWWDLVEKYQLVKRPPNRENKNDWAAKYHIGGAPAYYFSYLLGEMFASSLQKTLFNLSDGDVFWNEKSGKFLIEKLFAPGNKWKWDQLIENVLGEKLSSKDWLEQYAK
jgi:peptidyl-dipeptidase A